MLPRTSGAGAAAVLLHDDHALQLAPPGYEIGQFQLFRVLQGAHRGLYALGIEGQNLGVQLIGLGQLADGFGKVAQGLRVHNNHGQAGLVHGVGYGNLLAPSGFQQHDLGVQFPQAQHQGSNAVLGV